MNLTKSDQDYLISLGHITNDLPQIEEAMREYMTTYTMGSKRITRQEAIEQLGRQKYLSGLSRSAFHYSAVQYTSNNIPIYFDSSKLLK